MTERWSHEDHEINRNVLSLDGVQTFRVLVMIAPMVAEAAH